MGSIDFMKEQIKEKLAENFNCIKLKIGVDWKNEKNPPKFKKRIF